MKRTLCIAAQLQIRAAEGVKPRRFAIEAYDGGLLNVDGFDLPVVVDLAGLDVPPDVPILIDHQKTVEATLGITDAFTNNGQTLALGGLVTGQSPTAQQVIAQHDAGHRWQASIGAMVVEEERIPQGTPVTVNARTFVGPIIVARKSVLGETSVLPKGAAQRTVVNLAAAAAQQKANAMSFEDYCESLGLDAATLTPEAAAALQMAFTASQGAAPPAPPVPAQAAALAAPPAVLPTAAAGVKDMDLQATIANSRTLLAGEMRRVGEINAMTVGFPHIAATAIEQGWGVHQTENAVLKAKANDGRTRPTSFTAAQNEPKEFGKVLEAAVCMTRRIKNHEKMFDDKHLQAAQTNFEDGITLGQLFLQAAAANGRPIVAGEKVRASNIRDVMMYGFGHPLRAAFTTVSLAQILSNTANKELLQGFEEMENNWREISDIKSVSDFKTVTQYRMLDDMRYEPLGSGGNIAHGELGEETFTRSASTYAKMLVLTRQQIINDDLGALDTIRERLGRGYSQTLNRLVWTEFLSNHTTFWTTARTNYIEGATTNLGTDGVGLGLGVKAYRTRKSPLVSSAADSAGRATLGGRPTKLLVPPELETIADQLHVTRNFDAVETAKVNTHYNKYRPIVANELSDSTYGGGYSTTAWYLFGDQMNPIVTSFLDGKQTPTVETADADFDTLGVQFRGYHDFGCDQSEYMAGIKSKGAA